MRGWPAGGAPALSNIHRGIVRLAVETPSAGDESETDAGRQDFANCRVQAQLLFVGKRTQEPNADGRLTERNVCDGGHLTNKSGQKAGVAPLLSQANFIEFCRVRADYS